jgi:valyl-tRNA synthetase
MICLMNLETKPEWETLTFEDDQQMGPMVKKSMRQHYSSELINAVEKCVDFDPICRSEIETVKAEILHHTTGKDAHKA